jgi:hypothetical protein
MRLTAGSAPVAVKCWAVEPVNKLKTSLYFSTAQSREPVNKVKKKSLYIFTPSTHSLKLKNSVAFSPQANYTNRETAACWRS